MISKNLINIDTNNLVLDSLVKNKSLKKKIYINDDEFVSQDKINESMKVVESLDFKQMNDKLVNKYSWSNLHYLNIRERSSKYEYRERII